MVIVVSSRWCVWGKDVRAQRLGCIADDLFHAKCTQRVSLASLENFGKPGGRVISVDK